MKELFVGYEQALKLRELGFNELCFASISKYDNYPYIPSKGGKYRNDEGPTLACPLYQQAFDWFRDEKDLLNHLTTHLNAWGEDGALETSYGYRIMIDKDGWKCDVWEQLSRYETYEEARQALLNKLIEIVKNEKSN